MTKRSPLTLYSSTTILSDSRSPASSELINQLTVMAVPNGIKVCRLILVVGGVVGMEAEGKRREKRGGKGRGGRGEERRERGK